MYHKLFGVFFLVIHLMSYAQYTSSHNECDDKKPKLVVGIVVDQMRYDYVYRYWEKYSNDGFKRLVNEGFFCRNTHFNYSPTYTAPGHASIYTGSTPSVHGIIANEWYDRSKGEIKYCTEDWVALGVGGSLKKGKMSPVNMLVNTVSDELRLFSNMQSKVIGIALKDRGAIFPAGHIGNAAYWYDEANGGWMTSSYYMTKLPPWVVDFNSQKTAEKYLEKPWRTLLPIERYTESNYDNNSYESLFVGERTSSFPHDLPSLKEKNGGLGLLKLTPFGNSFTKDFAIQTIKSESMGKGSVTDFISISFSSTDYIGHKFGPRSIEIEDTYLRLDRDIAELLWFLDNWIGIDNVLVFLTADHGVSDSPNYLNDYKLPGGYFDSKAAVDSLKMFLKDKYADTLVLSYSNQQIFLNRKTIAYDDEINLAEVENDVATFMLRFKGVSGAFTEATMFNSDFNSGIGSLIQNGFNKKRSGDVIINLEPGWMEYEKKGTTHGSPYSYDTHVPLIWYGFGIKSGATSKEINITDIAPTVAYFLNIESPSGSVGKIISFK